MHALATFDRWIESRKIPQLPSKRPTGDIPTGLDEPAGEEALSQAVRQRWQVSGADWLHVLIHERPHQAGGDQWGLALWRHGQPQPEWLAFWPWVVRGCPPATLRTQLLRLALAHADQGAQAATYH